MLKKLLCCFDHHDWQGCECRGCGRRRSAEHSFLGCVCTICGGQIHQYGQWQFVSCCEQVRTCSRDGHTERQNAHDFVWVEDDIPSYIRGQEHLDDWTRGGGTWPKTFTGVCTRCGSTSN